MQFSLSSLAASNPKKREQIRRSPVAPGPSLPLLALPLLALLLLHCLVIPTAASATPALPLSSIDSIKKLSVSQADRHAPVRIRGVITYYDPVDKLLFVQDRTGGIFVNTSVAYDLKSGTLAEVIGTSAADFSNTVYATSIRDLGPAPMPVAKAARFRDILQGREDCNLVRLTGVVRSASVGKNATEELLMLVLSTPDGEIDVHMAQFGDLTPARLLNARVRISAVAGAYFNDQLQFIGALVRIPSAREITFLTATPGNSLNAPLRPISQILRYRTASEYSEAVRVAGTVTFSIPERELVIQNGNEALLIESEANTPAKIGDVIEVVGYPALGNYRPLLENARFRVFGPGAPIQPVHIGPKAAVSGKYSYTLVSLDAWILGVAEETNQQTFNFMADGYLFSASYPRAQDHPGISLLPMGSLVRLTGICVIQSGGVWKEPTGFSILIRSPDDLALLRAPSWWNSKHLLAVLGATAVLLLAIFAWVTALSKRVAAQSVALRRAAALQHDRNRVLELISCFEPVDTIIQRLHILIEHQWPGAECHVALFGQSGPSAVLVQIGDAGMRWTCNILSAAKERIGRISISPPPMFAGEDPREVFDVSCGLVALAVEHRQLYDRLTHRSQYDSLTGLANRELLETSLELALARAGEDGHSVAVSFIDLDGFKQVNDEFGHKAGDTYLQHIVANLRSGLRSTDTLARWGGDEFIVISPGLRNRADAEDIGRRLIEGLRKPFYLENARFVPSASLGIALYPEDDDTCEGLRQKADQAMYAAKSSGRDQVRVYSRSDCKAAAIPMLSGNQLREALDAGHFRLHYQPQFLLNEELFGFEALLRLHDPLTGLVPPAGFIEAAERSKMIVPIGQWALREACFQAFRWMAVTGKRLRMAVNVSAVQFADPKFSDSVFSVLAETGLPPGMLELELTETAVLNNVDASIEQMHRLRKAGIKFAIDDFGIGYSSLSYVHNLPIDTLKIDKSFIDGLHRTPSSLPVIRSIMSLATNLGTVTIAEGVENRADVAILKQLGCTGVQGFAFSRPLPPEEVELKLDSWLHPHGALVSTDAATREAELVLPG